MHMKRFLYISIVIFFLIALYFITLTQVLISSQNEFNDNVYIEAKETKNFNKFIAVQVSKYLHLKDEKTNDYQMSLYQILENDEIQKIVIILIPTEKVEFANNHDDKNDLSNITVTSVNDNKTILNTNDLNTAISYGYSDSKIGFMFFTFELKENILVNIKYSDYNGNSIIDLDYELIKRTTQEINDQFINGYTIDEIRTEMNYDKKLTRKLILRIAIYLSIVILVPFVVKIIKQINLVKNKEVKNERNN